MSIVRFLLNIIWVVFCGFWMSLLYVAAGIICFLLFFLVVTIPFGIAAFRLAGFVIWPFGRNVVERPDAGAGSLIGNIIWFFVAGIWIAIGHVTTSIPLFLSIIGIPFGWANLKMVPVSLFPLGKQIVRTDDTPFHT